ncbi:MAG TPA: PQQ-binding-like beta-propeller repeat protein, partial [Candidatus Polarisedimenticolia bacterium]|nr:PQQ-binding-like beta-propeller repeat protein [Candidatus Polarisedimenticolia bacterium]
MRLSRGRSRRLVAAVVTILILPVVPPVDARDAKSVFSGLPIDPDMAKPAEPEHPILFEPAWRFDGFSAPLAGDLAVSETLLAGVDVAGRLIALDPKEGRERWRVDLEAAAAVGPALSDERVLQGTSDGRLQAFAASDGRPLWTADLGAAPAVAAVAIAGTILQATRAPEVLAINPEDGTVTARLALESIPLPPVEARLKDGAVEAVIAAEEGQIRLVEPGSLTVRWRRALG